MKQARLLERSLVSVLGCVPPKTDLETDLDSGSLFESDLRECKAGQEDFMAPGKALERREMQELKVGTIFWVELTWAEGIDRVCTVS